MSAPKVPRRAAASAALRQARTAWRMQYRDSRGSFALAERARARAAATADLAAEGWARLTRGLYLLRYEAPAHGKADLERAQACFDAAKDEAGSILARAWTARSMLLEGRPAEALELLLPLREPGLRVLRQEERGMLLNNIAGCHSTLGQSAEAFAYMYQALRETSAARNRAFDVVLYNNIGHELCQIGDALEALRYLERGLQHAGLVHNPRLTAALLGNRVTCLIELDRAREALPDIEHLLAIPADATGRGQSSAQFETMALAALRAGEHELGADLVERATAALADGGTEDERIELAVASAELLRMRGDPHGALRALQQAVPPAYAGAAAGPGLRAHCLLFRALADLSEELGEVNQALAYLRTWQGLNARRMQDASRARFQAAALQTELLRLQHERDEIDARRRSSERAQQQLQAANRALSQKVEQVQALQAALRDQAVRDFLTGLYNRRHLNEVMPAMLALAERDTEPLAVVLIDLDHFKAVNDEHGHAAGDTVLAEFGALLARRLRKSDVACRYGGEEFCLLLPRTDARAARRKIASLQDAWRARTFAFETGSVRGCTFSAGITDSLDVRGSLEALLRAADAGGLEAKRRGRDRIVVFEPGAQRRGAAASVLGTVAGE